MTTFHSIGMTIGLLFAALHPGQASAQPAPEPPAPAASIVRTEVLLAIVGRDAEAARGDVVALLTGQLRGMGLSLVAPEPSGSVSDWVTAATRSKRALVAIVLDTSAGQGWRLVVVDAARSRAIARELPGGMERDAASVEAVVSIVISAASALRDGLEVASAPVETVVGPAPTRAPAVGRSAPPTPASIPPRPSTVVCGSIAAAVASFAPDAAATTQGAALALGMRWQNRVEARIFGTLFWPATVRNGFGDFRVNRALLGVAAGPVFSAGGFALSPQVGVVLERLHRTGTVPAAGLFATEAEPVHRVGGLVGLRLRRPVLPPLAIELVAGGAYWGRSVNFSVRNAEGPPFLEIGPVMGFAQLGIEIATE